MLWNVFRRRRIRRRLAQSALGRQLLDRAARHRVTIGFELFEPEIAGYYDEKSNSVRLSKKLGDEHLVRALAHELRHHEQKALGLFALRDSLAPLDAGIARRICEADAKAVEVAVCVELANSDPDVLKSLAGSRFDLARRAEHCFGRPPPETARAIFAHVADGEDWRAHYDLAEVESRLSDAMAGWPGTAPLPLSAFLTKAEELQVLGRPHLSEQGLVAAVMREDDQSDARVLLLAFEDCAYGTVRSSVPVRDLHNEVSDALQATAETHTCAAPRSSPGGRSLSEAGAGVRFWDQGRGAGPRRRRIPRARRSSGDRLVASGADAPALVRPIEPRALWPDPRSLSGARAEERSI